MCDRSSVFAQNAVSNWNCGAVPGAADTATLNATVSITSTVTPNIFLSSVCGPYLTAFPVNPVLCTQITVSALTLNNGGTIVSSIAAAGVTVSGVCTNLGGGAAITILGY